MHRLLSKMPLGNPMGGDYDNVDSIRITGIAMVSLPVSDIDDAVSFYQEVLNLSLIEKNESMAVMVCGNQKLTLVSQKDSIGGDRGIYLATPSIYDVQKRLADMPVNILQPPLRSKEGLVSMIMDDDGNIIHIIETDIV